MAEIKNTFGKLDNDKAPQFIQDGDYQYALNIRNSGSTGEQVGVIEPIRGSEKQQFNLPAGVNLCIGQYSHEEDNSIYFFVYNSLSEHQIIKYQHGTTSNVFTVVLRTPELNFQSPTKVIEAQIIGYVKNKEKGQLFFNDAFNEVRRLDLEECILFDDAEIWEFNATKAGSFWYAGVVFEGDTPAPFLVGDVVTVVRDWRSAWLDHDAVPEDGLLARYHNYDPNPSYSGMHEVAGIGPDNSMGIVLAPTGVQDFVQNSDGDISYIGGKIYIYSPDRKFTLPFQEDYIKLYRSNPPFPVFGRYGSDESRGTNTLRGHLYQFKTRYVYPNGMRSVPSPINDIITPLFEQNVPFHDLPVWRDNFINLWFDTGGHDVVAVELLVRESSNEVNQDWALVRQFKKEDLEIPSESSYNFQFYGDEVRVNIPVAVGTQPMDYIPHVGNAFCFIKDKRNVIGACEEGFDQVDAEVEIDTFNQIQVDQPFLSVQFSGSEAPTTLDGLPIQSTIMFPRNRNDNDLYLNTLGSESLYAAEISPAGLPIYTFSEGQPLTIPFPTDWEALDSFSDFLSGTGWLNMYFNVAPFGVVADGYEAVAGSVISITVNFRVSRHLVWLQQFPGLTPEDGIAQVTSSPFSSQNHLGVLSYRRFFDDPNPSYVYLSDTFTFQCEGGETAEQIRDYFEAEILASESLNTEVEIILSTWSELSSGGPSSWRSKTTTVAVGMETTTASGYPPVLRIRPTALVAEFDFSDQGQSAFAGTVSLDKLRNWYRLVGVNRMITKATGINSAGRRGFKMGANHPLAIEYRDSVGRRATVTKPEIHYIPYFNENLASSPFGLTMLIRILSAAPSWATHYQFMYAGNATMQDWLTFEVAWIEEGGDAIKIALSSRTIVYNRQNNIGSFNTITDVDGRSNVSYSWTKGDRLRFVTYWTGDQDSGSGDPDEDVEAETFVDIEIIGDGTDSASYSGEVFGLVLLVDKLSLLPYVDVAQFGRGSLVEVYTPKDQAATDQVLYHEIGQAFKVTGTQHHGNRLNQGSNTPGSASPFAEILLKNTGDAYVIGRSKILSSSKSKTRTVESSSFSDFYPSYGWGPGTANRYNPDAKRAWKKELIRYSDFILGDNNGLNRFFDGNVSDEPDELSGFIQRLECPEDYLYVFQELGTGMIPVRALELLSATGSSMIMRSDNVLGNINYVPGSFGIGNFRESLTYWGGVFYFPSIQNGVFLRLVGREITPISKFGIDDFWNTVSDYMGRQGSPLYILTAFDPKYGELIVHVPGFLYVDEDSEFGFNVFLGRTLAYSEHKKGWVTDYPFFPDVMGNHRNKLVSWKQGQLYIHDRNENWNQFYDNEPAQDSKITLVFNQRPQAVKFLQGIGIMMNADVVEPKEVVITSPYKGGQRTSLFEGNDDWEYQEDQFFASVWQNELTPGVEDPIINGDDMRGQYFIVELTFGVQNKFELFAVSLEHKDSEYTIKST